MCGNGGHVCPKVTHVFKNCRFHQCVNDMLCQIPVLFLEKIRKRKPSNRTVDTKQLELYNRNDFRLKGKVPNGWTSANLQQTIF